MRRRKRITSTCALDSALTRISPELGVTRRLTSFNVVVLPEPLRPSSTSISPRSTCRLSPDNTCVPPTRYETSTNSMTGPVGVVDMSAQHTGVDPWTQSSRIADLQCTPLPATILAWQRSHRTMLRPRSQHQVDRLCLARLLSLRSPIPAKNSGE